MTTIPSRGHIHFPSVSVIIPCYNESRWITDTVRGVLDQQYSGGQPEIFVVDNGSTDSTVALARQAGAKVLVEKRRSSYRARNLGIEASSGEAIVFIDGDCLPQPGWLQAMVECALTKEADIVAGRIENAIVVPNFANKLLALRRSPEERRQAVLEDGCVPGGNMLVWRHTFDVFGVFTTARSSGDNEFSKRIKSGGGVIAYCDEAVVLHQCDLSNFEYLQRAFRIRAGQEINDPKPVLLRNLCMTLFRIPISPGLRATASYDNKGVWKSNWERVLLTIYLWGERWFAYFGSNLGIIQRYFRRNLRI